MIKNIISKIILVAFFNISSAFPSDEKLIDEDLTQLSNLMCSTGQNFTEILPEEIVKKIYDFLMPEHDSTLLLINKFSSRMLRQWHYSPNAMIDFRENDFFDFALEDLINKVEDLSLKAFMLSRSCFSYHPILTPDTTSSTIYQIPKNVWRKRIGKVFCLPEKYWPKLPDSQIHTLHVSLLEDNTWRSVFNRYLCHEKLKRFLHIFDYKNLITTLNLSQNNIGVEIVPQLMQLKSITSLNLARNHVGNKGALLLGDSPTLIDLNLNYNRISDRGVVNFGSDNILCVLKLAENNIHDDGAKICAGNTKLQRLNLKDNEIGPEGGIALFKNSTLTNLDIRDNLLGEDVKEILSQNLTLKKLKL